MKKLYTALYILTALDVLATFVLLLFAPDRIPVHFNAGMEPDRLGSKWEHLIFPAFTVLMTAFFILFAKYRSRQGNRSEEAILLWAGVFTVLLFAALGIFFILYGMNI